MSKTVWVLGAGFSKSLGGPLLNDLFARVANPLGIKDPRPLLWAAKRLLAAECSAPFVGVDPRQ